MKAVLAIVLLAGLTAQAKKPVIEETLLKCEQFKNAQGIPMVGSTAPSIVRFPYDSSGGATYFVKTRVVAPNAMPSYDELTLVVGSIDGSDWESERYYLEVKPDGGSMISLKPSKTVKAPCTVVAE